MVGTLVTIFKNSFLSLVKWHLESLLYYLDPVVVSSKQSQISTISTPSSSWDFTFLFPIIAVVACILYGNVYLVYDHEGYFNSFIISTSIFFTFLRRPYTAGRYQVLSTNVVIVLGKTLPTSVSIDIIKTHKRFQKCSLIIMFCLYSFVLFFFYVHLFFVNAVYEWSPKDVILWVVVLPTLFAYDIYGFFGMATFVFVASLLVAIRQKFLLEALCHLNQNLPLSRQNFNRLFSSTWRSFLAINNSLADLCKDIDHCSAYWSAPLSVYFVGFITIQCYFAYIFFIVKGIDLLNRTFFLYVLLQVELFQFVLISEFARVAKLSGRFERACLNFYLGSFLKGRNSRQEKNINAFSMLKAEELQISGRLRPYAMHLLDNYRITSKTFYATITYNVLFFLMVFKNQ